VTAHTAVPPLPDDVLRACHARHALLHLGRAALFVALYLAGAVGAVLAAPHVPTLWLLLPLYLLAAASLHGLSLFTHEAVHGTLHHNRWLNGLLGAACALPVLQNFSAYRVLHCVTTPSSAATATPTTTRPTPAGHGWFL
jgi:fatty acid desaturase